jgi:hypothetical protein
VAVRADKGCGYGRGVQRGIAAFVEAHGRWSLALDPHASSTHGTDWLQSGVVAAAVARRLGRRIILPAFGVRLLTEEAI